MKKKNWIWLFNKNTLKKFRIFGSMRDNLREAFKWKKTQIVVRFGTFSWDIFWTRFETFSVLTFVLSIILLRCRNFEICWSTFKITSFIFVWTIQIGLNPKKDVLTDLRWRLRGVVCTCPSISLFPCIWNAYRPNWCHNLVAVLILSWKVLKMKIWKFYKI